MALVALHHESDYRRTVKEGARGRLIPGTGVEIIREVARSRPPRHVLFDFDGTLSLIREGWPEVMVPMMVEILSATGTKETADELYRFAYAFVMELNGKQTIYQMIRLSEEVTKRGARPLEPLAYKEMYHDRLMERIRVRREELRSGKAKSEDMLVPHAAEMLDELARRGAALYLASGTDEKYVIEEANLLGLEKWFCRNMYGAIDDYKSYSKAMVIERILRENRVDGGVLLGFGDGYVEIENVKAAGGVAVAVATREAERDGKVNEWKRDRLVGVGADVVIPDFRDWRPLVAYLWSEAHAA
jgi:phosphoglycolate phosphatase-like HAD superfamily hydrolase